MAVKIFRWKAIGPLLLFLLIIAILVWLFAEPFAKDTTEEVGTELLGTQVDIGKLDIRADEAAVDLHLLEIADPFDVAKNLVEAEEIRLKLNPAGAGGEEAGGGEPPAGRSQVRHHPKDAGEAGGRRRFRVPGAPLGAGVGAAVRRPAPQAHADRHDQAAGAEPHPAHDREDRAGARRPERTRRGRPWSSPSSSSTSSRRWTAPAHSRRASRRPIPRKLGVDGTRKAIEDVQASLKQLDAAKQRLAEAGAAGEGRRRLAHGRPPGASTRRGRRTTRSRGPCSSCRPFSAPEIGEAFFGKVSIDRFQQALYYTELARRYMPPGLLPKEDPGPERLRASGVNVRFPKEHDWPKFLVQLGKVDLEIGGDSPLRGAYAATVQGLTSDPSLYGKPTVVRTSRTAEGSAIAGIEVAALIDHVNPQRMRDSASARLRGVKLPHSRPPRPAVPAEPRPRGRSTRLRAPQ